MALVIGTFLLFFIKIEPHVNATCKIVAYESHIIKAELDGYIEKIMVEKGEYVNKGTLLLQYDMQKLKEEVEKQKLTVQEIEVLYAQSQYTYKNSITEFERQLHQKEARLRDLETDLLFKQEELEGLNSKCENDLFLHNKNLEQSRKSLENWEYTRSLKVYDLMKSIQLAQEELANLEDQFFAQKKLMEQGLVSEKVVTEMELRYKENKQQVQSLIEEQNYINSQLYEEKRNLLVEMVHYHQQKLDQNQAYYENQIAGLEFEINQLENTLGNERKNIEKYKIYQKQKLSLLDDELVFIEKRLVLEEEKKKEKSKNLELIDVKAPISGVVSFSSQEDLEGLYCRKGDELLRLVHNEDLKVEIYVEEKDIALIKGAGENVEITINAYPSIQYGKIEGQIIRVMPYTEMVSAAIGPTVTKVKRFMALASLTDISQLNEIKLLDGMEGKVKIMIDQPIFLYEYLYRAFLSGGSE